MVNTSLTKTKKAKVHKAKVHILESFDLGKNTAQNSGIEISVSGPKGKLGTIHVGQGTFAWREVNTKAVTKTGKKGPDLSFSWSEFAELMNTVSRLGKKKAQEKLNKS